MIQVWTFYRLYKYDIPPEFPDEVVQAAIDVPMMISEQDLVGRRFTK